MSSAAWPLIHVGYHKAGSTWMQRVLFASRPFTTPVPLGTITDVLVHPGPFHFDAQDARDQLEPPVRAARDAGLFPVISHERLSGNPHGGGHDSRTIADRLADVFPAAQVLLVVREQRSMIVSTYKQYVAIGGAAPLAHYLRPPVGVRRIPTFDFGHFEYDRLVAHYVERFGADRVRVLAFEQLATDPAAFVTEVARLADVAVPDTSGHAAENVGLPTLGLSLKRMGNRLFVRDAVQPTPLVPVRGANRALLRTSRAARHLPARLRTRADARLRRAVDAAVGDRYRDSNGRLAQMTGLPLADLGYPT